MAQKEDPGVEAPVESKVTPDRAGEQTMALEDALQRATPDLPFAGTTGDAGAVGVPALEAREYVALRAALLLQVAAREEILRRYQVPSEAALRALEEAWGQAGRRAELEAAVADFMGMVTGEVPQ